jgi:hypothetical protein
MDEELVRRTFANEYQPKPVSGAVLIANAVAGCQNGRARA